MKPTIVVSHVNTDVTVLKLENNNDKVAWITLNKSDGTQVVFFPQRKGD